MPTVFTVLGYRFWFYGNDHTTIHIHVKKGGAIAKYNIFPVSIVYNNGFKPSELKMIESILEDNEEIIAQHCWEEIDEDLSFEGFFEKKETTMLYKLFMAHPELNVSAIARRIGISQSLMAQYISGKKKPSDARITLILDTIREIGQELIAV